ncbi:hypothetical protein VTK73DRAFT_6980 [Phialemonium thermophilum]|uniref:Thioesterase domain-containing protein n=1 Tax=Phialemonium thermophilum TaxID=223376 RepID=A0ABR3WHB6_9PEZI
MGKPHSDSKVTGLTGGEDEFSSNIEDARQATGEERVRAFMKITADEKDLSKRNWMTFILPHLELLSSDTSDSAHPKVLFRHSVKPEHCNTLGNMHGGCTATLFDFCTSSVLALVSRPGFWAFLGVSRTLNVTYLRPAPCDETVVIECEIVQVGKKLCTLRGVMRRESDGTLLATCEHGKVNTDPPVGKL